MNDRLAFGAYQALAEAGLTVPDDISVVSFDDDRSPHGCVPACPPPRCRTSRWGGERSSPAGRGAAETVLVPMPLRRRRSWRRRCQLAPLAGATAAVDRRTRCVEPPGLKRFSASFPAMLRLRTTGCGTAGTPGTTTACGTCSSCAPPAPCTTRTAATAGPRSATRSRPTCTPWQLVADALVPADAPSWDDLATWTGCTVRGPDGRWYLFYTGVGRAEDGLVQRIGLAVSDDLTTWHRHGAGPLVEADPSWYETARPDALVRTGLAGPVGVPRPGR